MSIAEKILLLKEDMDTVYEKGKEKAMQAFSDAYQEFGNRTNYFQAFTQRGWVDETFAFIRRPICCKGDSEGASNMFARCQLTWIHVPVTIEGIAAQETFYYATKLERIEKLILLDVTSFLRAFSGCSKLQHMIIEGSIDVNFAITQADALDEETRESIVVHLKELKGLETQTLTLHKTVGEKLTAEQKAAITAKNWTLVY